MEAKTGPTGAGFEDLTPQIDKNTVESLNCDTKTPLLGFLTGSGGPGVLLRSDSDAQMILHFGFVSPVKIHHLVIRAPDDKSAPKTVKLFVNKYTVDFDSVENDEPTQVLTLTEKELTKDTEVRYVKFQNVKALTIFVEDNNGAPKTMLREFKVYGSVIQDTNVRDNTDVQAFF